MKRLGLICTMLLVCSVGLAQEAVLSNVAQSSAGQFATQSTPTPHNSMLGFVADDVDALGVPVVLGNSYSQRAGEDCATGSICGQDIGACGTSQWFFYTDLQFCDGSACQRVRCENFPPPDVTINKPIGIVTFRGVYVDDASDGCEKATHQFRIRFYSDNSGAPNTSSPVYTESLVATAVDTGETANFATVPATVWQFTAVLTTPVTLTTGWFSICGDGTPGCYFLWEGSAEGDNKFYAWYEVGGTIPGVAVTDKCDLAYCFGEKIIGACCDDRTAECLNNAAKLYCDGIGGRFVQNGTCGALSPACGEAPGACCYDDGTCTQTIYADCEGTTPPEPCYGDLNCDGQVSFADINAFVLYLSNNAVWTTTYAGCDPLNGDINQDSVYPAFSDINSFVTLLSTNSLPIVCTTARTQGNVWAGHGTTCDPYPTGGCCTVVVPSGAALENEPDDCAADVFNGGCNLDAPLFSAITLGTPVYGESATFDNSRDMDWYRFTTTGPATINVEVEAEFDPVIFLIRAGADSSTQGCSDKGDVAAPVSGTKCVTTTLTSRCVPAGTYFAVVAPGSFDGVRCYADYKVTVTATLGCEACTIIPCPEGSYLESSTCGQDPDPNGGCNSSPYAFEALSYTLETPFTVCGSTWANDGGRDLDWYSFDLTIPSQVMWVIDSEVPLRASMLFDDLGDGNYGPPASDCSSYYYWTDTLVEPCVQKTWSGTMYYQPGFYWFLVMPEDANGSVWYAYPCPMGTADLGSDYQITFTLYGIQCETEVKGKPHGNTEVAEALGPGYNDVYNSGCDAATPPGPRLTLTYGSANAWLAQSGTWYEGETLKKDYDWYQVTLTASQRFKVYLYADFGATWEIWPANNCAAGPIEGLDVPACNDAGIYTVRCYAAGTYWIRVYPTGLATIGRYYYLALTEQGTCTACSFSCTGSDLDDPCDDATDYDTNAGCDDPNAPAPHYMTFACGGTYCGRVYGKEINGLGYFDPDWFQITQTNATAKRFRLTVSAEFIAHVEAYASCSDYDTATPVGGLDGITTLALGTQCPNMILSSTSTYPQGTTIYGRITIVDQLGNLATDYYPCANAHNRWKIVSTCVN